MDLNTEYLEMLLKGHESRIEKLESGLRASRKASVEMRINLLGINNTLRRQTSTLAALKAKISEPA